MAQFYSQSVVPSIVELERMMEGGVDSSVGVK